MSRRDFLEHAKTIGAAVGLAGLAGCKAEEMLPDYSRSKQIAFTDERIRATYVTYDSPGGNGGRMRAYLVKPTKEGPFGAVLVVHENRGLNPYVKDVARRVAVTGFLALAPDALFPVGGYPGNDEDGKALQRSLDASKIYVDMMNSAKFLKAHAACNGRLGVTGFCFGGGVANYLAVEMGGSLHAAAPFYGRQPELGRVGEIRAELVLHYAENDPRINANKDAYDASRQWAAQCFLQRWIRAVLRERQSAWTVCEGNDAPCPGPAVVSVQSNARWGQGQIGDRCTQSPHGSNA